MTPQKGEIFIGTSGWVYAHWKGVFYPQTIAANRMLAAYANQFRTTEINSSFYRLPSPQALLHWLHATPPDFIFAVKASRYITHMKKLGEPEITLAPLLDRIRLLGNRLGPVLFQLPPRWHCNERRLAAFLACLPAGFRYTFEFRDQSWLNQRIFSLLAAHNAALCLYEWGGVLSPREVTADFLYVRLHGPGGPYRGSYNRDTLGAWAKFLARWAKMGKNVYCYFDNDEQGYAAFNARSLQEMVTGELRNQRR